MKNQIKKFTLHKTTISNLDSTEMNKHLGGDQTNGHSCAYGCTYYCNYTRKEYTCKCSNHQGCGGDTISL